MTDVKCEECGVKDLVVLNTKVELGKSYQRIQALQATIRGKQSHIETLLSNMVKKDEQIYELAERNSELVMLHKNLVSELKKAKRKKVDKEKVKNLISEALKACGFDQALDSSDHA